MSLSRRQFMQGSVLLFAAPAIVRAESLMKIWVPGDDEFVIMSEWRISDSGFPFAGWSLQFKKSGEPDSAYRDVPTDFPYGYSQEQRHHLHRLRLN